MHGDYGHFDLMLPYVKSINQHINGHLDSIHIKFRFINQYTNKHNVMSSLCKMTLGLGIWENNWATMFLSTYYQVFICERDYKQ
jgi:hypothetical protein